MRIPQFTIMMGSRRGNEADGAECGRPRPQQLPPGRDILQFHATGVAGSCCARGRAHSGIALIMVMICITVLGIMAALFAYQMKVETKLAMNASSEAELMSLGKSGVEMARWVLAQQMSISQEPYDALNQKWAGGPGSFTTSNSPLADVRLDNIPLGNGSITVKIVDCERKFNINAADQMLLDQAMRLIGVDAGDAGPVTASILDWIDRDQSTHVSGTESDHYETLDPPYQAKDGPIDDLTELLLVRGIAERPEIYWGGVANEHVPANFQTKLGLQRPGDQPPAFVVGLVDIFTPISSGRININTASATVLQMLPFVDENVAAEIIRLRAGPDGVEGTEDDTPFRNPSELRSANLNQQVFNQISRLLDVRSRIYEVQVDAQINGYHRFFFATLARNSPRDVQVLTFHWKFQPPQTSHAGAP
jgi:type II secretory pathway component PulK